jgi:hypothetical protein
MKTMRKRLRKSLKKTSQMKSISTENRTLEVKGKILLSCLMWTRLAVMPMMVKNRAPKLTPTSRLREKS